MRIRLATFMAGLCLFWAVPHPVFSATPKANDEARSWVDAKFLGQPSPVYAQGELLVYTKSGEIDRNAVDNKPLLIGSQHYRDGLHFAAGKVVVHFPSAAQSFTATIGADSNRDELGYGGRGSFILSVEAQRKELFHSGVMREGMTGVPITVDLGGAKEFTLELKPDGTANPWDDPAWDQADWAEARVTLGDGSSLALGDLPLGPAPPAYSLEPPFSFRYGGRPSQELLETWEFNRSDRHLDADRTEYVLTYRDTKTGLLVRCVATAYADSPTVEWTVYFKNDGTKDTPILEQIQALDTQFERRPEGEFVLHHGNGSHQSATDFQPLETRLEPRMDDRLASGTGRPTDTHLCYFNLEWLILPHPMPRRQHRLKRESL